MKIRGGAMLESVAAAALAAIFFFLFFFLGATGPARAGEGSCVSAEIPAPIVLPDGTTHEPATLSLCVRLAVSPVTALHSAELDGIPAAFMVSRRGEAEGRTRTPAMLFLRQVDGSLLLRGYAVPEGERTVTYMIETIRTARTACGRRGSDEPTREGTIVALGLTSP